MITRRHFTKTSLISGFSLLNLPLSNLASSRTEYSSNLKYHLSLDVPTKLFDGQQCWVHPRAGIIPTAGQSGLPRVVITMNTLQLSGSDVFKGMFDLHTNDLGKLWTEPRSLATLAPRLETIDGVERPVAASDFWPRFHNSTKTLLGIGHTIVYTPEWEVEHPRPRHTAYSVYDVQEDQWATWKKLQMPNQAKFDSAGAGCVQRYDEADGTILLPISFHPPNKNSHITVIQCAFDGEILSYQKQGNELGINNDTRGLHETNWVLTMILAACTSPHSLVLVMSIFLLFEMIN